VPGRWSYRCCGDCSSLWLDPRPTPAHIPALYPDHYYTHTFTDPLAPADGTFRTRFTFSARLGAVAGRYRYPDLARWAPSRGGWWLGRLAGYLPWVSERAGYFTRFLPGGRCGRLLDVGASNGGFVRLMTELGWEAVGIEPDDRAAEVARSRGLRVLTAGVETADLEPDSWDAVTLSHVLEHLPDPRAALTRLTACLKPGGVLVSISPNPVGWLARAFGKHWRELDAPRHLVLPSPEGYRRMMAPLGIEPKVWTGMRNFFVMHRDSLGIRRTGEVSGHRGKLRSKLATWLVKLLKLVRPELGEEVVCVAVKPGTGRPSSV
jgi:SAM-dependent methyltransferase